MASSSSAGTAPSVAAVPTTSSAAAALLAGTRERSPGGGLAGAPGLPVAPGDLLLPTLLQERCPALFSLRACCADASEFKQSCSRRALAAHLRAARAAREAAAGIVAQDHAQARCYTLEVSFHLHECMYGAEGYGRLGVGLGTALAEYMRHGAEADSAKAAAAARAQQQQQQQLIRQQQHQHQHQQGQQVGRRHAALVHATARPGSASCGALPSHYDAHRSRLAPFRTNPN